MKRKRSYDIILIISTTLLILLFESSILFSQIITPEDHFGFIPGTNRSLFNYDKLIDYLQELDEASPRLKMLNIGRTPMGKDMYVSFISSEENIKNLDKTMEVYR